MGQTTLKDVWKSVITTTGALSVMTLGPLMMPMWHVDNWDSGILVRYRLMHGAVKSLDTTILVHSTLMTLN